MPTKLQIYFVRHTFFVFFLTLYRKTENRTTDYNPIQLVTILLKFLVLDTGSSDFHLRFYLMKM